MVADQSFIAWKSIISAFYGFGIGMSVLRLVYSERLGCLWKDDWLATMVPVFSLMSAVSVWPLYQEADVHRDIRNQEALYWVMLSSLIILLWLTRIGLALTLGKTFMDRPVVRANAFRMALCFLLLFIGTLAWLISTGCHHYSRLIPEVRTVAYCNGGKQGSAIGSFTAIFLSDLALIALAFVTRLRYSDLSVIQSRNLISTACVAFVLLLGTVSHAVFYFSPFIWGSTSLIVIDMSAHLEAVISVISFNIPSLVTSIYWIKWMRNEMLRPTRQTFTDPKNQESHPSGQNMPKNEETDTIDSMRTREYV